MPLPQLLVTEYHRRTFLGRDGFAVVREGEEKTATGTSKEISAYLEGEIRDLFDLDETDPDDAEAAVREARRAIERALQGEAQEIALDPEPFFWAEIRLIENV